MKWKAIAAIASIVVVIVAVVVYFVFFHDKGQDNVAGGDLDGDSSNNDILAEVKQLQSTLQSNTDALQSQINGLDSDIGSLDTSTASLQSQVDGLDTEVGSLNLFTTSIDTKATSAQSDATQALTDASSASSTATSAQSDATQALLDASSASSAATSAQSDATQALTDSGTALSNASSALALASKDHLYTLHDTGDVTVNTPGDLPIGTVLSQAGDFTVTTNTITLPADKDWTLRVEIVARINNNHCFVYWVNSNNDKLHPGETAVALMNVPSFTSTRSGIPVSTCFYSTKLGADRTIKLRLVVGNQPLVYEAGRIFIDEVNDFNTQAAKSNSSRPSVSGVRAPGRQKRTSKGLRVRTPGRQKRASNAMSKRC